MKKGIDVSYAQGVIDWEKVKPNIDFAMIQAGYGQNHIDTQFVRNISECNRLGIPCGVYWFSYALNSAMAAQEAQFCINAIRTFKINYPVCFDFEYFSVAYCQKRGVIVTKAVATDIATTFLTAIEKAGYWAANYTNTDYLNRYFLSSLPVRFDTWRAVYPAHPQFDAPPSYSGIWQYSSTGTINGIKGYVDCNIAYKDYATLIK